MARGSAILSAILKGGVKTQTQHFIEEALADESQRSFAKELSRSQWVRCFSALCLLFLGTWLLNQFVYPQVALVYGMAREFATAFSGGTCLAIAFGASLRPDLFRPKPIVLGASVILLGGFAIVSEGLAKTSPELVTLGCILMSIGRSTIMTVSCVALIDLSARSAALCIAGSLACAYALRSLFVVLPSTGGLVAYPATNLIAATLAWPLTRDLLNRTKERPAAATLALTEPRSFLPFAHVLFVSFFAFRIAYGFSITFGAVESTPLFSLLPLVPLGLVALQVIATGRAAPADILYQVACLFVLAGFLATLVPQTAGTVAPNMLLAAGGDCFSVLMYYTLAAIGRRNPLHALPVFAWGQCASSIGTLVGTSLGHLMNGLFVNDAAWVPATVAIVVLAFVAFNITALRSFGFERTIAGVEAVPEAFVTPQNTASPSSTEVVTAQIERTDAGRVPDPDYLDHQSARLAQDFALTEREAEVFRLLARGRNVPFIEEELVISRNTIKTHIKHIYQKMDLHSQQELIDMAETY